MSELNCYLTTFNCGRSPIHVDYFAANFFRDLKSTLPPDLIVLCLQEVAPIGYSFLGGSFLAPYFKKAENAVLKATSHHLEDESYDTLIARNVGMTAIMVFVRREMGPKIQRIESAGVGVGLWEMGNKGAAAVRLSLAAGSEEQETVVTFVAAHLAPMEDACQRRNEDWRSICEGLVFERSKNESTSKEDEAEPLLSSSTEEIDQNQHTLFSPISNIFFAGDLNYRTSDAPPHPEDHRNWPQPTENDSDIQHYKRLLEKDQLTRELRANRTLHNLSESPITFAPTYKYSSAAQKAVAHSAATTSIKAPAEEDQVWLWAKHRVPSWCDRILYLASAAPNVHSYTALPVQPTSDHRPVALSFSVPCKGTSALRESIGQIKPPFTIRSDWRQARAAARRYEIAVGVAAYLTLTWEGEALVAGTFIGVLGGYLVLRALLAY